MGKDKRSEGAKVGKGGKGAKGKRKTLAKLPKKKCCVSSTRCNRCPLRMLKEGTLPEGYTVKKRKLVKVDATGARAKKSTIAA